MRWWWWWWPHPFCLSIYFPCLIESRLFKWEIEIAFDNSLWVKYSLLGTAERHRSSHPSILRSIHRPRVMECQRSSLFYSLEEFAQQQGFQRESKGREAIGDIVYGLLQVVRDPHHLINWLINRDNVSKWICIILHKYAVRKCIYKTRFQPSSIPPITKGKTA